MLCVLTRGIQERKKKKRCERLDGGKKQVAMRRRLVICRHALLAAE